jgi:hypothetical protein
MKLYTVFEDIEEVIRIRKWKDWLRNGQRKKGQTAIYKTLHRKLKIKQHGPPLKPGWTSGTYPWSFVTHIFRNG